MKAVEARIAPQDIPTWQQERRDKIVAAARSMLEDGDYDQIQIRDIAARSGFALGTVYRYFRSKEHLYAAVMVEWYQWFWDTICATPLPPDPHQRIEQLTYRMISIFEDNPQYLRVEIVLETSVDQDAVLLFQRVDEYNRTKYRENLPDISLDVVRVISIVTAAQMHHYALGHISIAAVRRQVSKTLSLVLHRPAQDEASFASSKLAQRVAALGARERNAIEELVALLEKGFERE